MAAKNLKGIFITFEGAEGSGKSTQAKRIVAYLKGIKKKVLHIREPGGVKISERIRDILLSLKSRRMSGECEVLLYMAARAQLVEEVICPALKRGDIVLCDRFLDSTIAYQGYGNGANQRMIQTIGRWATANITPDLTLLFDIDAREGLRRAGSAKDRIEKRPLRYHQRVRRGYLALARREPGRIKVIKVDGDKDAIHAKVRCYIDKLLGL